MLAFVASHRRLAIVLSAFFVCAVLVWLSFHIPVYREYCSKNEYTGAKECSSYRLVPVAFFQIAKIANDYGVAITALATIFVAAFTGTLWWTAAGQYGLLKEDIATAKTAARAAVESAEAAKAQAEIAKDSLVKIQRPYIYIFGVDRIWFPPPGRQDSDVQLRYTVANYGQTPAVITCINLGFLSAPGRSPPDEMPGRLDDIGHWLITSPVMPPQDVRRDLRVTLPEEFIGDDLGAVVDLREGASYPVPRIKAGETLYFRMIISYDGPFSGGYETSVTWFYYDRSAAFVQLDDKRYTYRR